MSARLLENRIIFLTGGSTGIGLECAKAYAAEGARVAIIARGESDISKAMTQLGPDHLGIVCDVAHDGEVRSAIDQVKACFGGIDVVHNNAGIATPAKPLHETTDAEWEELFAINLKGVLHTTRHAYATLKERKGCILNTSSLVGVIGQEMHAAYTATKGGMNTLTKSMALDYAPHGIRVNAVCPAGTWTPMLHQWCSEQPDPDSMKDYLNEIHPLGYCPEGDVIADACVFLVSDKARFITGHIMHVSGGAEIGYRRPKPA
jgi:NAD(P)-dependent dehydrogenase (short-subunit alcohol dehydrogenase family)